MIELKDISKTYSKGAAEVRALQKVSLKICAGEFVAIMGASGSGKSTLMHIMGLLDRPDSGSYTLGGRDVTKLTDDELAEVRNRLIGFVFQQFHLLPRMTALENAELPLIYAGKRHLKEIAKQKIKDVGLGDRMEHAPNELSGGQQQRVAIARSLVNEPPIIMADEPTGNLDTKSREEIMAILRQLNEKGKTVIVVTHEADIAERAKRVIRMSDGMIISDEEGGKQRRAADKTCETVDSALTRKEKFYRGAEFLDYLRQAASSMATHKLRSFLSILGILIGVAAVIAMLALGQGAQSSIEKQLASLGSNLLMIMPGSQRSMGIALATGTVTRFTFQDINAISKLTDEITKVSPVVNGRGQLVYADKNWNTQIEGGGIDYAQMRNIVPKIGRYFTEEELKAREKVAVIGLTVARELFGEKNPVGETIKINLINFKVIGVQPERGSSGWRDQDDNVIIPVTTAMYRLLGKEYIDSIFAEVKDPSLIEQAQDDIKKTIIKQHHLNKNDEDSFQIRNMAELRRTLESTTKTMSLLLGAIAAISLLVGGIGIMNIMLVSVTERTREIGLRMAIGARRFDIMVQFVIEAMLITFIGGLVGIALGIGISVLISTFAGWAVKISPFSVGLATGFSIIVGLIFGLWPAYQASQLDPIEALRYE